MVERLEEIAQRVQLWWDNPRRVLKADLAADLSALLDRVWELESVNESQRETIKAMEGVDRAQGKRMQWLERASKVLVERIAALEEES